MRKVVVTGGAGFIGSHITEELVRQGANVIVIDDFSGGSMDNIKHLLKEPNLQFVKGSITDLPLLQKYFSGADYIFHQAAIASVPASIDHPLISHEVNTTGTLNVLLAARDNSVKKVVFASSCAVYGDTKDLPLKEDILPRPLSPYAATKVTGEYYCGVFQQAYGIQTVCLRYFNVYGQRQQSDSQYAAVIPKFIQCLRNGNPPIIFGDGEQSRDFVFIKDVVAANLMAAESDATGIFNIGVGEKVSLNQLARIILKIMNLDDIKPIYEKKRSGDIKQSLADISKAHTFGYKPKYDLEMGLSELLRETNFAK